MTTRKAPKARRTDGKSDEMRREYDFDYRKAKPNRFANRLEDKKVVVTLEPDVAEVFTRPETVNDVLRALIRTMPPTPRQKAS
jgi:hypothetical protein